MWRASSHPDAPATSSGAGEPEIRRNAAGGQAVFLRTPSEETLGVTLDRLKLTPDVALQAPPTPLAGNGVLGYTHRMRAGKHIYYFGNSSDTAIDTTVTLRGRVVRPELWNPHGGRVTPTRDVKYRTDANGTVRQFRLAVAPISSMAVVARER